jgi:hypothetical protein
MSSFLNALKGIGAVLAHLGEDAAKDPAVEQAIATLVTNVLKARTP